MKMLLSPSASSNAVWASALEKPATSVRATSARIRRTEVHILVSFFSEACLVSLTQPAGRLARRPEVCGPSSRSSNGRRNTLRSWDWNRSFQNDFAVQSELARVLEERFVSIIQSYGD